MSESYTSATQHIQQVDLCSCIQDLIPLYLDKEVSPQTYAMIDEHLRQCERCSSYLAGAHSIRTQMLRDQQVVRATVAAGPSAAQVRQPVVSAVANTLWRGLMTLTWLGGLLVALAGATSTDDLSQTLLVGMLMVGVGIAGFLASGSAYGSWWRLLMIPVWLMGLFLLVHPWLNPSWAPELSLPVGLVFLVMAAWGLWPHRRAAARPPAHQRAHRALHTAVLSILGAALCSIAIAVGFVIVVDGPFVGEQLIGIALATAGVVGLLLLNHRRAWTSRYSSRRETQQLISFTLIGSGALASILILQTALERSLPLLIAGGLIVGGIWWLRKQA